MVVMVMVVVVVGWMMAVRGWAVQYGWQWQ